MASVFANKILYDNYNVSDVTFHSEYHNDTIHLPSLKTFIDDNVSDDTMETDSTFGTSSGEDSIIKESIGLDSDKDYYFLKWKKTQNRMTRVIDAHTIDDTVFTNASVQEGERKEIISL